MPVCPHCLSTRVRLARFEKVDYLNVFRLRFPYRCRDCASRFHNSVIKGDRFEDPSVSNDEFAEAVRERPTTVEQERRAMSRSPCTIETYCYPTGRGETQYPSWIVNLSCSGLKLRAERRFNPGDNVTVRLRNSIGKDMPRKFHVMVVHIYSELEKDNKGNATMGCRFRHALSNEAVDSLLAAT